MRRSTKITSIIISFFLIIAIVVVGRTLIGNHFKKKFSKIPPPGIIVKEVQEIKFSEKVESFGTAVSKKTKSFRIQRNNLIDDLKLKDKVKKGEVIVNLKDGNIIAPFSGSLGYRGLTEDILGSENSVIITLDDSSIIFSDIKIPESFAPVLKRNLPISAKFSGFKNKKYSGIIEGVSSRINAETRSILVRVKIDNKDQELIPGSLLEVTVYFNDRKSLGIPDTSIILEGNKVYVYKISKENIAEKTEIKTGLRSEGKIEVISGLDSGDIVAAEGLKKVRPFGKINPIKN